MRTRWPLFLLPMIILVDRLIKYIALRGRVSDVWFFHFGLVKNDALVFSWPAPNWVAIVLMVLAIGIVGVAAWSMLRRNNFGLFFCTLLVLIGALSNLYDRVVYGYVVDWAYVGPWWPVFNVADAMIAAGVMVALFKWPRLTRPSGTSTLKPKE